MDVRRALKKLIGLSCCFGGLIAAQEVSEASFQITPEFQGPTSVEYVDVLMIGFPFHDLLDNHIGSSPDSTSYSLEEWDGSDISYKAVQFDKERKVVVGAQFPLGTLSTELSFTSPEIGAIFTHDTTSSGTTLEGFYGDHDQRNFSFQLEAPTEATESYLSLNVGSGKIALADLRSDGHNLTLIDATGGELFHRSYRPTGPGLGQRTGEATVQEYLGGETYLESYQIRSAAAGTGFNDRYSVINRLSSDGDILWSRVFTEDGRAGFFNGAPLPSGNTLAMYQSFDPRGNEGGVDLLMLDANGTAVWSRQLIGVEDAVVVENGQGSLVVAGEASDGAGYLVEFNESDGSVTAQQRYTLPATTPADDATLDVVPFIFQNNRVVALVTAFSGDTEETEVQKEALVILNRDYSFNKGLIIGEQEKIAGIGVAGNGDFEVGLLSQSTAGQVCVTTVSPDLVPRDPALLTGETFTLTNGPLSAMSLTDSRFQMVTGTVVSEALPTRTRVTVNPSLVSFSPKIEACGVTSQGERFSVEVVMSGGQIELTFPSKSDVGYSILRADSLNGTFSSVGGRQGTGGMITFTRPEDQRTGFYKVVED